MGFLDNSGDIILDAVLTDTGRMRLARGDGSFKIVKFALGDDEINYELYDKNNASGSAYYDLEILQSPVLEAFTDNAASMKSKLVSIPRNNLLYLPVLRLNEIFDTTATAKHTSGNFLIAVDSDTETELAVNASGDAVAGILFGENPGSNGNRIRVDQGLDTNAISPGRNLDPLLLETQYLIEMDNRLGYIVSNEDATRASISFVDDDNIASYYLSRGTDKEYVGMIKDTTEASGTQIISGPRGTRLVMKVGSSLELNTSDFLFDTIGTSETISTSKTASQNFKTIKSNIRVTGVNTGYRIDIPVKFCKKTT
tara:strand:+ start:872 stop:1807 length:936 start_codon:yes stop_codon:yes gene_type:complete